METHLSPRHEDPCLPVAIVVRRCKSEDDADRHEEEATAPEAELRAGWTERSFHLDPSFGYESSTVLWEVSELSGSWVVAVDVGGTFTDAVAIGGEGGLRVAKVPSTPNDPSIGLAAALAELAADGVIPAHVRLLSHGTTIATNAILTGRMGRVVLIATEGFRDILAYRGGSRPDIYSLTPEKPSELVPREDRLEVRERLGGDGSVVTRLTKAEIARVVEEVAARKPEAVAIALLFSYR